MKTVLLADDNESIVELIKLVLAQAGYNLIIASDGKQAVQMCLEQTPDLVFMDIKMPNMDGFAATRILRDKGFKNPIVVLTSSESEEDRKRAEHVGCNDYILKTMDMNGVEETLDRYLREVGSIEF